MGKRKYKQYEGNYLQALGGAFQITRVDKWRVHLKCVKMPSFGTYNFVSLGKETSISIGTFFDSLAFRHGKIISKLKGRLLYE